MAGGRRRGKGPRGNESPKTIHPKPSVTQKLHRMPDENALWSDITVSDIRDIVNRYGHWQLRFPVRVIQVLLAEIDRLEVSGRE